MNHLRLFLLLMCSLGLAIPTVWGKGAICVRLNPKVPCPLIEEEVLDIEIEKHLNNLEVGMGSVYDLLSEVEADNKLRTIFFFLENAKIGKISFTPTGVIGKNFAISAVPLNVGLFSEYFKLGFASHVVATKNKQGAGNPLVSGNFYYTRSRNFATVGMLGYRIPNGASSIVGSRQSYDVYLAQSMILGSKDFRFYLNYSYILRPKDNDQMDKGDTFNALAGIDYGALARIYLAFLTNRTAEDRQRGEEFANQVYMTDLAAGFALVGNVGMLRLGILTPNATDSRVITHSQRTTAVDAAFLIRF